MNPAYVENMTRMELLDELKLHAHATWYHSLLQWNTPRLKALLVYYRESAKEGTEARSAKVIPFAHDCTLDGSRL